MTYTAYYDASEVTENDIFLSFSGSDLTFTAEFLERFEYGYLINTNVTYSLQAEFTNWPLETYPTVSTASASSKVVYMDPCDYLLAFTAEDQTNIPDDEYSGTELTWNLIDFNVNPAYCLPTIRYNITSVTGPSLLRTEPAGSHDYTSHFTDFDLVFDEDGTDPADGMLLVSATST